MKKTGLLSFILILMLLASSAVNGAEPTSVGFSAQTIEVEAEDESFQVTLELDTDVAFSSANFGIELVGVKAMTSSDVVYADGFGDNSVFREKNGVYYFGFNDFDNTYTASGAICTITLVKDGAEDGSVKLVEGKIGRLTEDSADVEVLASAEVAVVVTDDSGDQGGDTGSDDQGGNAGSGDQSGNTGGGTQPVDDTNLDDDEIIPETLFEVNFLDLNKAPWASSYIIYLAERGVVNGVSATSFNPDGTLTREAFIKMLVEAFDLEDLEAESSFKDIAKGKWYYSYVATAEKMGITNGVGNGNFGLGQTITREQMAAMAFRTLDIIAKELPMKSDKSLFADDSFIAGYAVDAVYQMQRAGIFSGKGQNNFAPKDTATRAEAAKIIYMLMVE